MNTKVYILRTCRSDMTSPDEEAKGFRWPESGPVECSDWDPSPVCEGGLHGLLWGEGNEELLNWDMDAKWLVVEAEASDVIEIDQQKAKFPKGNVVFCGDRKGATDFMQSKAPNGKVIVGAFVTVGDGKTAVSGYEGTATAGHRGTATAGRNGRIQITFWDGNRYRTKTGYIGEDGLKPNIKYKLNEKNEFEEVK